MPNDNTQKSFGYKTKSADPLSSLKPSHNIPKPNKKIFIPNLNVTRNKSKGPPIHTQDNRRGNKGQQYSKYGGNKNNSGRSNIIMSGGIFSQGCGRGHHTSHDMESSSHESPVHKLTDVKKIDKDLIEQQMVESTGLKCDEVEDFKLTDINVPVKLPMDDTGGSLINKPSRPSTKVKNILHDPLVNDDNMKKEIINIEKEELDSYLVNLLQTDQSTHILVKMPEILSGHSESVDKEWHRQRDDFAVDTSKSCYLKHLEEGQIGKLLIHQSGKVKLNFRNKCFEVKSGTKSSFYQEIVSVAADDSLQASVVSLGRLIHKMLVYPELKNILKDMQ